MTRTLIFPKSVYFIVSNEFCERFCYFGMRTILFLYLIEMLRYPNETATLIFHVFTMLAYFFPIMGATVADSWLGKYRTILYLTVVYVIGQIFLSASSTPLFHLCIREISLLGLFFTAMGTGGIKPCVSAFGAEQFKLPEQEAQLSNYFNVFYFAINCGALISTLLTPTLRKDVTCFGLNTCYPLAFLVPTIVMASALLIFIGGSRTYNRKEPEGNIILVVASCICRAIKRKICSSEKHKHWLDYAKDMYESNIIDDTKAVLTLLRLLIPLVSMFYALYDQTGSRWTYQATRMDGETFGYLIKPDQFAALNMIIFIIAASVSSWMLYPLIGKFFYINTPLRKMALGGTLAATSFVMAAILELKLETTSVVQPSARLCQIRIFNTINCPVDLSLDGENYKLEALGLYENLSIPVIEKNSLNYELNVACPPIQFPKLTGRIEIVEEKAVSYLLTNDGLSVSKIEKIDKSESGNAMVRTMVFDDRGTPANLSLHLESSDSYELQQNEKNFFTNFEEINHNTYDITVDEVKIASGVSLRSGGVYTILGRQSANGEVRVNTVTVVEPNSIHMVWLLPQYVMLTLGEMMVLITGTELSYTEAPNSMKSLAQSFFLINSAIGNLIVVIITKAHFFDRQAFEFLLYAGLMYVGTLILIVMAVSYKYVGNSTGDHCVNDVSNQQVTDTKQDIENEACSERQ